MSILDDIQQEMADFTSDPDGFTVPLKITSKDGKIANINGLSRKHHLKLDPGTGMMVNSRNASATISELKLKQLYPNFPIRNADKSDPKFNTVQLKDYLVEMPDISGEITRYTVIQTLADETKGMGLIVLILGGYDE